MTAELIAIAALVVAGVSLTISVISALICCIDTRRQQYLERTVQEIASGPANSKQERTAPVAYASKQPVSTPIRAGDTPPQVIAPKLKNPPIAKGGFGSRANASQIQPESGKAKNKD